MLTSLRLPAAATLVALLSVATARAECSFSPYAFFPDRNDRVRVVVETERRQFLRQLFPGRARLSLHEGLGGSGPASRVDRDARPQSFRLSRASEF